MDLDFKNINFFEEKNDKEEENEKQQPQLVVALK